MVEDVKPARKSLMAIEDRIELSEWGHDTLEQKRGGLIMELTDILDQARNVRANLNQDYERAQNKINMAHAMKGDMAVRGAVPALKEYFEITTRSKNIMGVVVLQIGFSRVEKSLDQRGYGLLDSSACIDEAAGAYEELLESTIFTAEVKTATKKMLEEVETAKRRANTFEFKLPPGLCRNQECIEQKLEEQECEEIFHLKEIKVKKEEEEREERATGKAATEADTDVDTETATTDWRGCLFSLNFSLDQISDYFSSYRHIGRLVSYLDCDSDLAIFAVPESLGSHVPETALAVGLCVDCLRPHSTEAPSSDDASRLPTGALPDGDAGVAVVLLVGMPDSLALNRADIVDCVEPAERSGADVHLMLGRLQQMTTAPHSDVARRQHQLDVFL